MPGVFKKVPVIVIKIGGGSPPHSVGGSKNGVDPTVSVVYIIRGAREPVHVVLQTVGPNAVAESEAAAAVLQVALAGGVSPYVYVLALGGV